MIFQKKPSEVFWSNLKSKVVQVGPEVVQVGPKVVQVGPEVVQPELKH